MSKHLLLLAFFLGLVFLSCNKDEISDLEDRVDKIETISITDLEKEMKQADDSITRLSARLNALDSRLSSDDEELGAELDTLRAEMARAITEFQSACNAAIAASIAANNTLITGQIADSLNVARVEYRGAITAINAEIQTLDERVTALEKNLTNRIQSLTYLPRYDDGRARVTADGLTLEFVISPAALADSIFAGWRRQENTYAFLSTTAVTTRAGAAPAEKMVYGVEVTAPGVISVYIPATDFPASFFRGDSTAVVYIHYTDGNNDVISDVIPLTMEPIGDITEPADVNTGDIALLDGSFVSNTKIATMKSLQKKIVAGVVFWTPDDEYTGTSTPASLTDDKLMARDYPNCTHGLIVSLYDLWRPNNPWQNVPESVASVLNIIISSEMMLLVRSPYAANSGDVPEEILGYQNTVLLEYYNQYKNQSADYIVNPVANLASFSEENPAPKNSTGWFVPSPKELSILLCGDQMYMDDNYMDASTSVQEAMNEILGNRNWAANLLEDMYASSTEQSSDMYWCVDFALKTTENNVLNKSNKQTAQKSRPICAF